jgi:mono/diheme cytochrome c family protein
LPGFGALPGTQQLQLKYRDTSISPLLEERTDLVPEFVKVIVRQGVSFMPQFRKTEISDAELDALAAYLARNNPAR